jgi:hypothetical protein
MSNLLQKIPMKSLAISSAITATLILATPILPASAQGVPAGLLRLDSSQAYYAEARLAYAQRLADAQEARARAAYARVRTHNAARYAAH